MENISKQKLLILKQNENEFLKLVDLSAREDLAQCTKILAMYIALYRQKFGEIPEARYENLMTLNKLDTDLVNIFHDGINEATEMLKMILLQKQNIESEKVRSSYLN